MLQTLLNSKGNLSFWDLLLMFFSYAVFILVIIPVHDLVKAFVADKLGDHTPRWHGCLRFDPFSRLDLFGTLMLVLFGFGFSRPMPINPRNFRNPRRDLALTALAGPVSYALMAALSIALFRILTLLPLSAEVLAIAYVVLIDVFATLSAGLTVFTILPIPPMDGWRVLSFFLPDRWVDAAERYSQYISMGLLLLLFTNVLDLPLFVLRSGLLNVLFKIFGF